MGAPYSFPLLDHLAPAALGMMDISLRPKLWSAVAGIPMNSSKFKKAGERIHVPERHITTRKGISREDDTLPARFFNEGRKNDPSETTLNIKSMFDAYYQIRGFDDPHAITILIFMTFIIFILHKCDAHPLSLIHFCQMSPICNQRCYMLFFNLKLCCFFQLFRILLRIRERKKR